MKKFLFTLASLFVAGTAFANSYLYMDKVNVTADMVGEELELPVKAHYEEYVSAWEMWVEAPEGLVVTGCEAGEDMTISYYSSRGKATTLTAPVYGADGHYITAVADAGYTPEKVTYGCVKWAPGEYEEMLLLYVEVTDAYVGGDISIRFEPACGQDTRFGDDMRAKVAWGNTVPWIDETMVAAEPELAADNAENPTQVIATDGAVLYRLDETTTAPVWVKVENPFDLPAPAATEQTIQFMACMPNGDGLVGSDFVPLTVVIPAATTPAQPAPEPKISQNGNVVSAAVEGEDAGVHEVELYIVNGEERTKVDNPYTVTQTYAEQEITFVAVTLANQGESEDTECEPVTLIIPALEKDEVDSPSVQGMSNDDAWLYNVIILGEGDGELKYTVVDENGEPVTPYDVIVDDETGLVTLVFEKGNEDTKIIVTAWTEEGETCQASDEEEKEITIPALDKVATPEINYTVNDNNTITVYATCATDGATIVLVGPDGTEYTNPAEATVSYDPYVGYNATWTATATKEHMQPSEGSKTITLAAGDKTPVEAPSIMGMKAEGSKTLYNIVITPAATDGDLDYTATPMGALLRAGAVTIQYERGEEPYDVEVTAKTLEGATCQESPVEQKTITVPALDKVATPTVYWAPNEEGSLDVWATTTTDDATVTLTDGTNTYTVPAGEHVTITYDPEAGYNKTWTATASATDMLDSDESDPVEIKIDAVIPPVQTGEPTITVVPDYENAVVVVTITGADENDALTGKVTFAEGEPLTAEGEGVITIEVPMGEEVDYVNIYATAVADAPEGVDVIPNDNQELFVEIPARTAAPTINQEEGVSTYAYMIDPETHEIIMAPDGKPACLLDEDGNRIILEDGHFVTVTLENNDEAENVVMEYSLDGNTWLTYDELLSEIIFGMTPEGEHVDGTFDIYARATAVDENGNPIKGTSEVVHEKIVITPATSVNELANGKTVAGVRYFNMAGQEMNEANGVTIVVTTYTDGTTSAVKVIK